MHPIRRLDLSDEKSAVVAPDGVVTYGMLEQDYLGLRSKVAANSPVAIKTSQASNVAASLFALDGWASSVHLLPPDVGFDVIPDGTVKLEDFSPGDSNGNLSDGIADETKWLVYSSGTTGAPKTTAHSMASLSRTASTSSRVSALIWGMLYDPNRMAGLQVLIQSLTSRTTVVAPTTGDPLVNKVEFLRSNGVTALSATPTMWRLMLQVADIQGWDLEQVSLGGEIADQRILDSLSSAFPNARVVHIFASTETGAAFAVTDGQAGFPLDYLTNPPRGIALDVRDGTLFVFNQELSIGGGDGFVSTEDEVRIDGNRVFFMGRKSGSANIGGAKVWPEEVERILRLSPIVKDASVAVKSNPFSGSILTAKVTVSENTAIDVPKQLRAWVKSMAPSHYVPATITVVERLEVSIAGKVRRS